MIWIIFAYLVGIIAVQLVLHLKNRTCPIKNMKLDKYGIIFSSTSRHKVKTGEVKLLVVGTNAYLKKQNKTIVLKNVKNVEQKKGFVYFTGAGIVRIVFNAKRFYKYFNVRVESEKFSINDYKFRALDDILANLFEINNCVFLRRYLNIMRNILKINLDEGGVKVSQNKFSLKFSILYKLNGKAKKVNIQ